MIEARPRGTQLLIVNARGGKVEFFRKKRSSNQIDMAACRKSGFPVKSATTGKVVISV